MQTPHVFVSIKAWMRTVRVRVGTKSVDGVIEVVAVYRQFHVDVSLVVETHEPGALYAKLELIKDRHRQVLHAFHGSVHGPRPVENEDQVEGSFAKRWRRRQQRRRKIGCAAWAAVGAIHAKVAPKAVLSAFASIIAISIR